MAKHRAPRLKIVTKALRYDTVAERWELIPVSVPNRVKRTASLVYVAGQAKTRQEKRQLRAAMHQDALRRQDIQAIERSLRGCDQRVMNAKTELGVRNAQARRESLLAALRQL